MSDWREGDIVMIRTPEPGPPMVRRGTIIGFEPHEGNILVECQPYDREDDGVVEVTEDLITELIERPS